jgi:hypothetical protein
MNAASGRYKERKSQGVCSIHLVLFWNAPISSPPSPPSSGSRLTSSPSSSTSVSSPEQPLNQVASGTEVEPVRRGQDSTGVIPQYMPGQASGPTLQQTHVQCLPHQCRICYLGGGTGGYGEYSGQARGHRVQQTRPGEAQVAVCQTPPVTAQAAVERTRLGAAQAAV